MALTARQANMIAHVLHEIRPSWAIDGTRKVLEDHQQHPAPFGDILAAAVTAARDPETRTPARIFQVTAHWPAKVKPKLPKPEACEDHTGQDAYTCRSCWGDIKAGLRPESALGKHHQTAESSEAP